MVSQSLSKIMPNSMLPERAFIQISNLVTGRYRGGTAYLCLSRSYRAYRNDEHLPLTTTAEIVIAEMTFESVNA